MILIDTNVFSEIMNPNVDHAVQEWLSETLKDDLFLCSITIAEISSGIEKLPDGSKKELLKDRFNQLIENFDDRILVFGEVPARAYGQIMAMRKRNGRPMEKFDCMIASIAVTNNLDLATRNVKDFDLVPNLKVINPWSPT
ncbi:MAG: putative nucleic acid-binding protein [Cellvibrionaceae bacterium]|jgi:predicted nucleic acid-binding protein